MPGIVMVLNSPLRTASPQSPHQNPPTNHSIGAPVRSLKRDELFRKDRKLVCPGSRIADVDV
jgi:hypothetical protein